MLGHLRRYVEDKLANSSSTVAFLPVTRMYSKDY